MFYGAYSDQGVCPEVSQAPACSTEMQLAWAEGRGSWWRGWVPCPCTPFVCVLVVWVVVLFLRILRLLWVLVCMGGVLHPSRFPTGAAVGEESQSVYVKWSRYHSGGGESWLMLGSGALCPTLLVLIWPFPFMVEER